MRAKAEMIGSLACSSSVRELETSLSSDSSEDKAERISGRVDSDAREACTITGKSSAMSLVYGCRAPAQIRDRPEINGK